jgi:SAM-dependent methyltransferase
VKQPRPSRTTRPHFFDAPELDGVPSDTKLGALAEALLLRGRAPNQHLLGRVLRARAPALSDETRARLLGRQDWHWLEPSAWAAIHALIAKLPNDVREDDVRLAGFFDQFPDVTGLLARANAIRDLMIDLADVRAGEFVLDPCMGTGELLLDCLRHGAAAIRYLGMEAEPGRCLLGLARGILCGAMAPEVRLADALDAPMQAEDCGQWDCVLLVPPWGRKITKAQQRAVRFQTARAESALLQHALDALRPGGRLVMLVNDGLLDRQADRELRRFLLQGYEISSVRSLPLEVFAPETNVRVSALVVRRAAPAATIRLIDLRADASEHVYRVVPTQVLERDKNCPLHAARLGEEEPDVVQYIERSWIARLADVAQVSSGCTPRKTEDRSPTKADPRQVVRVVRISEMRNGVIRTPPTWYDISSCDGDRLCAGDVLVSRKIRIGEVAVVAESRPDLIAGDALVLIRPDPRRLSSEFLAAVLRSPSYQAWLKRPSPSTTPQTRVRTDTFREMPLPVPPRSVQDLLLNRAACEGRDIDDLLAAGDDT